MSDENGIALESDDSVDDSVKESKAVEEVEIDGKKNKKTS
jgi:hypothetical protein